MKKKQILICDDVTKVREDWKAMLKAIPSLTHDFEVVTIDEAFRKHGGSETEDAFKTTLAGLESRRRKARDGRVKAPMWGKNLFDSAAILIVDYDLLDFSENDYITGESVAYLTRCYSRCGLVVALNQAQCRENTFDLTLKCNPESFADLNINSAQLGNLGLWKEPWNGFRPWYWPILPVALDAFEHRIKQVRNNLDKPILSYLGFEPEVSKTLPRSTREFLGGGETPEDVTFREFVEKSGYGLRGQDSR